MNPRERYAEFELLRRYNSHRSMLGHDYGNGARYAELSRRRRELDATPDVFRGPPLTADELADAYDRVGAPRARRAQADADRYGSWGATRTARAWETIRLRYARKAATALDSDDREGYATDAERDAGTFFRP